MSDWKTKLKEAKEMLDMGLLDQDEFDALKAELKQEALVLNVFCLVKMKDNPFKVVLIQP